MHFELLDRTVDTQFWSKLSDLKLNKLRLSEEAIEAWGYYTLGHVQKDSRDESFYSLRSRLTIPSEALSSQTVALPRGAFKIGVEIVNFNILEGFRTCDKQQMLYSCAQKVSLSKLRCRQGPILGRTARNLQILDSVNSGAFMDDPALLNRSLLLAFSDLKRHRFYSIFATAAIYSKAGIKVVSSDKQIPHFDEIVDSWLGQSDPQPIFIVRSKRVHRLCEYDSLKGSDIMFAVADCSSQEGLFGWPIRNFLFAAHYKLRLSKLRLLVIRDNRTNKEGNNSRIVEIEFTHSGQSADEFTEISAEFLHLFGVSGYCKNEKGGIDVSCVDLGGMMDPRQYRLLTARLATNAVELNLQLMRWRLMPELNLEKVFGVKALLLGTGTLGCNVARLLVGWGVRNLTLVDSGQVSLSNPVRQSLFSFEQASTSKPKAAAAAETLRMIHPGLHVGAVELDIPMPGHPLQDRANIGKLEALIAEHDLVFLLTDKLEALIAEHDLVFLLTDTRESRWLPTLLCAKHHKAERSNPQVLQTDPLMTVNIAMGFDTFVVMRHGTAKNQLGCYFCSDISLTKRTLDQQCTVTRPGLSMVSSGLGVELAISMIQHVDGADSMVEQSDDPSNPLSDPFGILPHQYRGFLSHGWIRALTGQKYDNCVACSPQMIDLCRQRGEEFVVECLLDPKLIERHCGIEEMQRKMEDVFDSFEIADEEF